MDVTLHLVRVDPLTGARCLTDETAVYQAITSNGSSIDLGPSWPALHVMLTNGEPPMPGYVAIEQDLEWDGESFENLLMGGEPTPYEDELGFARYLAPATVRRFAPRLSEVSETDFVERLDDDILEYLPPGWDAARARPVLVTQFQKLVAFYRATAVAGDGLLLHVS